MEPVPYSSSTNFVAPVVMSQNRRKRQRPGAAGGCVPMAEAREVCRLIFGGLGGIMGGGSRSYYLTFAILASLVMAIVVLGFVTPKPLTGDSHQQVRIAYHLIHTGVWGYDNVETPTPRPQIKREPIPILPSAVLMLLDPAFDRAFSIADVTEGSLVARIKRVNAVWIFLASFGIFLVAADLFKWSVKSALFSVILVLICAYTLFIPSMDAMETEVPGAFFLLLATWLGIRFTRDSSVQNAVLLGVGLGLLSLVKAAFLYIGVGYIGLLFLVGTPIAGVAGRFAKPNVRRYGLVLVALLATISPWIVRNVYNFYEPVITSRGGDVLAFRALLTEQPLDVWLFEFSPQNVRPAIAVLYGSSPDEDEMEARYDRFKQDRWDFYYKNKLEKAGVKLHKRHAEVWLALQAVKYYAHHPIRYAASSLLFAYRGIWAVRPPDLPKPVKAPVRMMVTIINAAAFLAFAALFVYALVRRNPVLTAFTGLAMGSFLFYSLFTHNIPRYSEPILPIVFLALLWCLNAVLLKLRNRGRISRPHASLQAAAN